LSLFIDARSNKRFRGEHHATRDIEEPRLYSGPLRRRGVGRGERAGLPRREQLERSTYLEQVGLLRARYVF
jgi:hypothetical protein